MPLVSPGPLSLREVGAFSGLPEVGKGKLSSSRRLLQGPCPLFLSLSAHSRWTSQSCPMHVTIRALRRPSHKPARPETGRVSLEGRSWWVTSHLPATDTPRDGARGRPGGATGSLKTTKRFRTPQPHAVLARPAGGGGDNQTSKHHGEKRARGTSHVYRRGLTSAAATT